MSKIVGNNLVIEKPRNIKFVTVEPWDFAEDSTRNCFNCMPIPGSIYCRCRLGHFENHKLHYTYNGIIKTPRTIKPCDKCKDFDNDW